VTTGLERVPLWVYNFGPAGKDGRTMWDVTREVRALCNVGENRDRRRKNPKMGVGIEALRWGPMPTIQGQLRIHDDVNLSRANIVMYVAAGFRVLDIAYVQHTEKWDRTETKGVHEPRATLLVTVEGNDSAECLFVGTHAPPVTATSGDARKEWVDLMVDVLRNSNIPVVMGGDPNGLFGRVRDKLGNPQVTTHGTPVEATLTRGYYFDDAREDEKVNGVVMGSDHHRAHRARLIRRSGT
jgi:hypothetical protein